MLGRGSRTKEKYLQEEYERKDGVIRVLSDSLLPSTIAQPI